LADSAEFTVERMETPGAAMSTFVPRLEKLAIESLESVAATPMTLLQLAGAPALPELLFPADATMTTPRAVA
jgi:hypothetical protein